MRGFSRGIVWVVYGPLYSEIGVEDWQDCGKEFNEDIDL